MATLRGPVPAEAYGRVHDLGVRQFGSKKMLHLLPAGASTTCTMVLCHRNATVLSELKVPLGSIGSKQHFLNHFSFNLCLFLKGGVPDYRTCVEAHPERPLRPARGRLHRDPPGRVCQTQGELWSSDLSSSVLLLPPFTVKSCY